MIEVKIAGIQVSLTSQHRVVLLKEIDADRYLPIWIGPFEAEAINFKLQQIETPRPMTHDLLKNIIETLGGAVQYIVVSGLHDNTFYARIVVDSNGQEIEIDARPSDSIALAVRVQAPIYVDEQVMDQVGIVPEQDLTGEDQDTAFDEFLSGLNIDDLPIH
ncbi:MAG: bifunctional nuclease family protein [Anaerolineae bacterium]|nr:bifunctional nuclease family protein [Anaerolineae bacterium]